MKQIFSSLITILFLFSFLPSTAQNCACNEVSVPALQKLRDENDSLSAFSFITKLKNSANKNCRVYGYTLEIWLMIANKKTQTVPEILHEQEKYANSLSCKDVLLTQVYQNYTRYYKSIADYENMSLYAFKALSNAETQKNKEDELYSLIDVIYVLNRQEQDDRIPVYLKRAEKIVPVLGNSYSTAANYNWLAFNYETWYTLTQRRSLLDTAMLYAGLAIKSAKSFENYDQVSQSFRVYEAVSYHQDDIRRAIAFMDSALFYGKKSKTPVNLAGLYLAKATDHLDLGENAEALRWTDTAMLYVERDYKGSLSALNTYKQSADVYEAAGNLPKAYATFKKFEKVKDSLFRIQRAEKIDELEQQYNKAKNEKTIKELAQQKRIYILLAAAGLFALLGLLFFIRQQTLKNKQKILETEQRLNRARMNPHFFFNALSALQSYALQGNDGKSIASNLSKFSHIMRETLESTYKEYVTIEQENDFLKEYLELQKIRFPQKFYYGITIEELIEPDEILIPSMILQPFTENSIEHGFSGISYPGHIAISFSKKENELHISIIDNGKGLATTAKENSEHISRASQIIKDRIYLLNIKLKTKAAFSIDNNKDGKGVAVLVKLPLLYKQEIKA